MRMPQIFLLKTPDVRSEPSVTLSEVERRVGDVVNTDRNGLACANYLMTLGVSDSGFSEVGRAGG
jgi:hypothetical protein